MTPRKDRRFKQWNKTQVWRMTGPRATDSLPSVEAFTYDISIGGARLHTAEKFEVGSRLRLQTELVRTGDILRVEAVVKWRHWQESANVYEMGVEFEHSSMVTVLTLMKNLHDGRRAAPAAQDPLAQGPVSQS